MTRLAKLLSWFVIVVFLIAAAFRISVAHLPIQPHSLLLTFPFLLALVVHYAKPDKVLLWAALVANAILGILAFWTFAIVSLRSHAPILTLVMEAVAICIMATNVAAFALSMRRNPESIDVSVSQASIPLSPERLRQMVALPCAIAAGYATYLVTYALSHVFRQPFPWMYFSIALAAYFAAGMVIAPRWRVAAAAFLAIVCVLYFKGSMGSSPGLTDYGRQSETEALLFVTLFSVAVVLSAALAHAGRTLTRQSTRTLRDKAAQRR